MAEVREGCTTCRMETPRAEGVSKWVDGKEVWDAGLEYLNSRIQDWM
jgi:hypothetical protein